MQNYTTQMDAARKGIVTPEMEIVAKKEYRTTEEIRQLVAEGKVAIPANKHHTCLNPEGIVASKIAAHAADIAKGIPHARDIDDKMGDARRVLDWDAQFACALDPETAKAIRDARLPEDDHSDTCSMCGKFCAVRSMNKALAGEYIDIL